MEMEWKSGPCAHFSVSEAGMGSSGESVLPFPGRQAGEAETGQGRGRRERARDAEVLAGCLTVDDGMRERETRLYELIEPTVTSLGFELVGVLISADERMALVRQDGVTDLQRVAIGRSLNGWRIDQIEPDHVVFSAGETVRRVELRADEPPKVETARDRRLRERAERRQEQEREQAERRSAPDRDLSDTQPENMSAE